MGQRHQIFLIARIRHSEASVRYRCIAAFHHQWLYGRLPLAACSSFITLVKSKDNAPIVEAELAAIGSSQYEEFPETPAPFLSSMLSMALSIQMEKRYSSFFPPPPLNPNMSSLAGDNNDGVTVIDVTDPSSPAYCFVSISGLEAAVEVPMAVPLTAETYVRAYYPLPSAKSVASMEQNEEGNEELQLDVEKHINLFNGVRLIEPWMLNETWPEDGYGKDKPVPQMTGLSDIEPGIPPLIELCLQTAVEHTTSEDIAAFEAAISRPGVGVRLFKVLAKRDHLSDAITSAMTTVLSERPECDQSALDLSPYSLTAEQVIQIASHFPKTEVLNLNNNCHITGATLGELLPSLPELTRLIIYDCPGISATDVLTLRFSGSFPNLLAVYHRGYMMCNEGADGASVGTNADIASPRTSFTFALGMRSYSDEEVVIGTTVPFLSPRAVVISMCDIFDYLSWRSWPNVTKENNIIRACFTSLPRAPNVPFAERAIGNVPGDMALCAEGWMFLITFSDISRKPTREHGFVKYKFSEYSEGQQERKLSPPEVEVTNLAGWLEALNATDKVEKEWVERLSGYLGGEKDSLITKEKASERLTTISRTSTDEHPDTD